MTDKQPVSSIKAASPVIDSKKATGEIKKGEDNKSSSNQPTNTNK